MRIFYVTKQVDAEKIATYLIRNRIVFHPQYTWPDKISGPPRFIFKLGRHVADSKEEMSMLSLFLEKEDISIELEEA